MDLFPHQRQGISLLALFIVPCTRANQTTSLAIPSVLGASAMYSIDFGCAYVLEGVTRIWAAQYPAIVDSSDTMPPPALPAMEALSSPPPRLRSAPLPLRVSGPFLATTCPLQQVNKLLNCLPLAGRENCSSYSYSYQHRFCAVKFTYSTKLVQSRCVHEVVSQHK